MGRAASLGTFDGVHRGHLLVLDTLRREASRLGAGPGTIFTFDQHPMHVISPRREPKRIMLPSREKELLEAEGFEVDVLHFTEEMMHTTASDWLERMHRDYGVDLLVMGYDNTFGSDGLRLNISDYRELGRRHGIEVVEAPRLPHVSSSAIRRLIADGEVEDALLMLGRPFVVAGTVRHGDCLGRTIGIPTANIEYHPTQLLPADGVYAAECMGRPAVVNIGVRPTLEDRTEHRFEVHVIDFTGDLYGRRLEVSILRRLRGETKFDSLQQLALQIEKDMESARSLHAAAIPQ